ncbi:MAG: M36 family metallopeptidase, partial [Nocardioidaceae bacterium]
MSSNRRRGALTALAITAAAGLTLTALPNGVAASAPPSASGGDTPSPVTHAPKERMGNYDARTGSPKAELRQARKVVGSRGKSFNAFTKGLGRQAIVDYDPATGTPRNLTKLNGYLTDPSSASAKSVAMDYVRAHLHNLGLVKADLGTFHLRRDYVDVAGIHHISWTQHVDGITVFGNGLKANVTKDGRLLSIQGSPVSGLTTLAKHATTKPRLSAAAARAKAADDVDGKAAPVAVTKSSTAHHTTWKNNDSAQLVWFKTSSGLQLGWSTYVQAGGNQLNYQ